MTLVFESSRVFIRHEVEWMSGFHVHRYGVVFTGFVAVFAPTDTGGVTDEERLLDPATSSLVKAILV
jgi:hypothetical protein